MLHKLTWSWQDLTLKTETLTTKTETLAHKTKTFKKRTRVHSRPRPWSRGQQVWLLVDTLNNTDTWSVLWTSLIVFSGLFLRRVCMLFLILVLTYQTPDLSLSYIFSKLYHILVLRCFRGSQFWLKLFLGKSYVDEFPKLLRGTGPQVYLYFDDEDRWLRNIFQCILWSYNLHAKCYFGMVMFIFLTVIILFITDDLFCVFNNYFAMTIKY